MQEILEGSELSQFTDMLKAVILNEKTVRMSWSGTVVSIG